MGSMAHGCMHKATQLDTVQYSKREEFNLVAADENQTEMIEVTVDVEQPLRI